MAISCKPFLYTTPVETGITITQKLVPDFVSEIENVISIAEVSSVLRFEDNKT